MRRALFILTGGVLVAGLVFGVTRFAVSRLTVACTCDTGDDLAWFRREFHLNDAEMARVRQLHEGYLPQCEATCQRIAEADSALTDALSTATNLSPVVEARLAEVARLRAQCQTQMLRHFFEVSQAMPPEQGRRYMTEMERLTLRRFADFEEKMAPAQGHAHGPR
ncbi:MAG TPA: periplasmic heavy metal sensor [Verrucomicrobiae bacterium]|jgi:hypothetical protein